MKRDRRTIATDPKVIETYQLPARSQMQLGLEHAVDRAMGRLLDRQVEIIRMVVDEKLTFEQIGKRYGIDRRNAYDRYKRAKLALRRELLNNELIREIIEDDDNMG